MSAASFALVLAGVLLNATAQLLLKAGKYMADDADFVRAWNEAREAYALFAVRDFERLREGLAVPMEVAARGPRYIIVRKP